jgi:class 3 adenylate cyclase
MEYRPRGRASERAAILPFMLGCIFPASEGHLEAERRQVTVLFADMVGFTSFSEKSGEEAAYTLMRSLSKLMGESVRQQGGTVQSFTGDGIMAVFGAPLAFEDAPLRACRAALAILQSLRESGPELEGKHGLRPQMRIGLNTGAAIVGKVEDGSEAGVTVLGDTVNFAARLQTLAEPDSVLMSEATHRLVQGMIGAIFCGEHQIKGKAEPQKTYRLNSVRQGATRFDAAVSRGLSAFVGRERELEALARSLDQARSGLCVIDVAGEPGMGKSRLVYEFRQRIGKERAFVLSGSCSPDGQQTPLLPFIEVVRGSFRVSAGEGQKDVAQKLEIGLTSLGLHSIRNLGLLLHLLGLKVPDDALKGLDGVLIGLRTRELLQQLLEARCRLSPVVMVIEDLHWIDSASEELLGKIVQGEAKLRFLLLHTRRPEYTPPWSDRSVVTKLLLDPLAVGDIRHLIQARLGIEALPDALARQVTDKAEGNPLFTEEIVSFLSERGILHAKDGKLEFDAGSVAAALPASVQGALSARVDRLAPKDRALLQAASVIGRQFDSQLLAAILKEIDVDERLAAMQALDLVRLNAKGDCTFKHALVRDALYESLLTEARNALHLKIAEEIERRSGNRLAEVAEILAHHYSQTAASKKAFTYLSMAGSKSLGVYSLDEATTHFSAALALLDKDPDCASDDQVADFLVAYYRLLLFNLQITVAIEIFDRYSARVKRLRDDPRAILIGYGYAFALLFNARFREASTVHQQMSDMAHRLGDNPSLACALTIETVVSWVLAPKSIEEFAKFKKETIKVVSDTQDPYIDTVARSFIALEEATRGRMNDARDTARGLIQVGQQLNDPRSIGLGLNILAQIALFSDSAVEALEYCEQSLAVAITQQDRFGARNTKGNALIMLRRVDEGAELLEEVRRECISTGNLFQFVASDGAIGACKLIRGEIASGLHWIDRAILQRENEGFLRAAHWYRIVLSEVYLQILAKNEKLPLSVLLKNLPVLVRVMFTAPSYIHASMMRLLKDPFVDPSGLHAGRAQMMLGLLYRIKRKPALALQHLTEARRILLQFEDTPILGRVETALAELRQ